MRRAVITGMGAVCAIGRDIPSILDGLKHGRSGVRRMEQWSSYKGLNCQVGAPAELTGEKLIPRQNRRSMGRMGIFTVQAAEQAVADAALDRALLTTGRAGSIVGSTMGGGEAISEAFEIMVPTKDISDLPPMKFFQCVAHTASLNLAQHFSIRGSVMATSAACSSGLQAIGTAADLIRLGRQDIVLAGGAEELHATVAASFDVLFATSTHFNDDPSRTPRPFDRDRDGLVCGEGSGIVVVEEYEHAMRRGARILAEIAGYATTASGLHVSQSNGESIIECMTGAMAEAGVDPTGIDYISAHATATQQGDQEEVAAIRRLFGDRVPVSGLKGYIGHTLGASGAVELIMSLAMMKNGTIYPTRNLENLASDCEGIYHVREPLERKIRTVLKNCFAFGGISTCLVCRTL